MGLGLARWSCWWHRLVRGLEWCPRLTLERLLDVAFGLTARLVSGCDRGLRTFTGEAADSECVGGTTGGIDVSQRDQFMKDVRAAHASIRSAHTKVDRADAALEAARDDELRAWAALYAIKGVEAPATAHMLLEIPMGEAEAWFVKVRRLQQQSTQAKAPNPKRRTVSEVGA